MTIPTLRPVRGKMVHAIQGNRAPVTSNTEMAVMYCGKEYTGYADEAESPEAITCSKCQQAVLAELAAELAEVHAMIELHGEPTVLSTPETIREPRRRRYKSPGHERHCRIIQERAERRRAMKAMVAR